MTVETLDVLGAPMIVKEAEGVFLAEHPIPPGYCVPPHRHDVDEEMLYVVEGTLTLLGPGGETVVGPGTGVTLPAGSVHGYRNDSGDTVRLLVIARPGLQAGEMFRHLDRASRRGPISPSRVGEITAAYGVRFG